MDREKEIENLKLAIAESSKETKVYVGCDSKRYADGRVKYATVVILHINGNNGCKMYSFIDNENDYNKASNPKMRLVQEAYKAVDLATQIMDVVQDRHFELHLDLNSNPKYKSNTAVKEALGYVIGVLGLDPKLKPYAWASSTAADRLVH
jgi:predicted RNase H-related nuclease YkuK (DUF458 family)